MSIEIYTGTVGSMKSYHAMETALIKVNQRKNNIVVANFPITIKNEKEENNWYFKESFEPMDLIRISFERGFYGKEGYALLIVDEAGTVFNSRDWQIEGNKRKEWINFFSQSRKFGYDVIMIAQDARMIDKQIRKVAEYEVKHVNLRKYKWFKYVPVPIFAHVYYWQGGAFKASVKIGMLKPWIAKRYNTFKLFNLSDEFRELAVQYGIVLEDSETRMEGGGTHEVGGSLLQAGSRSTTRSKWYDRFKKKEATDLI